MTHAGGYIADPRVRAIEWLPWALAVLGYFVAPTYLPLGSYVLTMILFALSLDLILGYGGIITLGHSAYFGTGAYTAGLLAVHLTGEPLLGLLAGTLAAALLGLATGLIILRTQGLALLMLTLAIGSLCLEIANKASGWTGGADGLGGFTMQPILGLFKFDFYGRTAYVYCLAVLFACWWLVRRLVYSPFGASLTGVRENGVRMRAVGAPVYQRLVISYTISAALAGLAGALLTQTTQFVGLKVLGFELSGELMVMLILGGVGRIYGAFVGPLAYLVAQDYLAKEFPEYWYFGIGAMLVLVVMFARGGILGIIDGAIDRLRRMRS
ncbi:MAG: ABC transporter permease [Betaproteobacteria bacterium RIFCSPLOWO2_12_FULL_63_13]|nr:MAG: ABC transporter permease [Betaproteobacteria bacterium RIFCSPLOWO2_02_FULL_63_19]OGA53978.1 MAG: ABC transporter permease [Betaproteobacteria bacterium RIFCSPLOWO2_12_FULL_63_13]